MSDKKQTVDEIVVALFEIVNQRIIAMDERIKRLEEIIILQEKISK